MIRFMNEPIDILLPDGYTLIWYGECVSIRSCGDQTDGLADNHFSTLSVCFLKHVINSCWGIFRWLGCYYWDDRWVDEEESMVTNHYESLIVWIKVVWANHGTCGGYWRRRIEHSITRLRPCPGRRSYCLAPFLSVKWIRFSVFQWGFSTKLGAHFSVFYRKSSSILENSVK